MDKTPKSPKEKSLLKFGKSGKPAFPDYQGNVKTFLSMKGKTLNELCDYLKMSRQALYKQFSSANPNLYLGKVIAEYLEISLYKLFGDIRFETIDYNEKDYEYFLLTNRLKLLAERRGYTFSYLAKKLNTSEEGLIKKLDELEKGKETSFEDGEMINKIFEILDYEPGTFFFTSDGSLSRRFKKGDIVEPKIQPFNTSSLVQAILEKKEIADEIINHFLKCYPEDYVSYYLKHGIAWDDIQKSSPHYNELLQKIKTQMHEMGLSK